MILLKMTEEKAILVGSDTKESLEELKELAKACDIPVLKNSIIKVEIK